MCLFPISARLNPDGGRPILDRDGELQLPCGSCIECIKSRAADWATRARHEISCHEDNCFLTLTYDDEHLPSHLVLKDPLQRFIHNLRRHLKKKILYMASHEYGSRTFRPHHHAIIFGYNPKNQEFLKYSKSGEPLFTSPEMAKLWPHGSHSIGSATEKSASYIAQYALKGKKHEITLPDGEIINVSDSFDCSKRPGIGLNYLKKNYKQLVASKEPLPRYYIKKLADQKVLKKDKTTGKLIEVIRPGLDNALAIENECYRLESLKQKTHHQILAKHTISNAQIQISNSNYREDQREQKNGEKKYLKRSTDLQQKFLKEEL